MRLVPVPCPEVGDVAAGLRFEVDLDRIDERDEPGEELEMDGMSVICLHCGAVGELHDAGKLVALGSGGEVDADVRLEDARDLGVEAADRVVGALLLRLCGAGFPSKEEGVDDHAVIVVGLVGGPG